VDVNTYDAYKPDISTRDQVSWFSDFVCILYNLKTIRPQVGGRVSWTRRSKFQACSWIRPQTTLTNTNNIFSFITFYDSMHLQFKLVFLKKIQLKQINQTNIAKSLKNVPNSSMEYEAMCEDHRKLFGGKTILSSFQGWHSANYIITECSLVGARQRFFKSWSVFWFNLKEKKI
jgi:hypothetical protein